MPIPSLGHVTSSYRSEAAGRSIALALIVNGREMIGKTLYVTTPAGFTNARVTEPVFFDVEGSRINA
jgi:sarcosine oxidase subunit alpha